MWLSGDGLVGTESEAAARGICESFRVCDRFIARFVYRRLHLRLGGWRSNNNVICRGSLSSLIGYSLGRGVDPNDSFMAVVSYDLARVDLR